MLSWSWIQVYTVVLCLLYMIDNQDELTELIFEWLLAENKIITEVKIKWEQPYTF